VEVVVLVVVGAVLGLLVDTLTPGRVPFGWLLGALLGIIGAAIGAYLLPGLPAVWYVGSLPLLPTVLGALVLTLVVELVIAFVTRRPTT
jgi:uncharacterized membrane protein YeaQ/YmgE (transglycosylase-associated protein family)